MKQLHGPAHLREMLAVARADAFSARTVQLRRVAGGKPTALTTAELEQLIADARAGRLVELCLDTVTYVQRPRNAKPSNSNLFRFKDSGLRSFAASFAGKPALRDHDHNLDARAGSIRESTLEDRPGEPGVKQIRMEFELCSPWAVEHVARHKDLRFSIGAMPTGDAVCSICDEPMVMFWGFSFGECEHEVGEVYDGSVCQLEYSKADGIECSIVNVPAVEGTGVDDMCARFNEMRASARVERMSLALPARFQASPMIGRRGGKENRMKTLSLHLIGLLALAEASTDEDIVAGVEALRTGHDGLAAQLADARLRAGALEAELGTLRAAAAAAAAVALEARKAAALARGLDEGRFLPGSKSELHAKKLAERGDVDGLDAFVEDLPKGGAAPIGGGLASGGADPTAKTTASGGGVTAAETVADLTSEDLEAAKRMNKTPEQYLELKRAAFAPKTAAA